MKVNLSTLLRINVLGVKIDDVSIPQIVKYVEEWLGTPFDKTQGKHYIVTPNPEIVVMAQRDLELKKIINQADLSIPDGRGLKLATDIENISPGVEVLEALVKMAAEKGFTVGFLGGAEGVAEKTAECLLKKYKNLKVVFAECGGEIDDNANVIARRDSDEAIFPDRLPRPFGARNDKQIDILFVAFGPPKQEKWIANNLDKIPVRVAMGVGGSFDYISGQVPRAPEVIRLIGFEWLFRLIIQPWRIKRQLALLKYIWLLTMGK